LGVRPLTGKKEGPTIQALEKKKRGSSRDCVQKKGGLIRSWRTGHRIEERTMPGLYFVAGDHSVRK